MRPLLHQPLRGWGAPGPPWGDPHSPASTPSSCRSAGGGAESRERACSTGCVWGLGAAGRKPPEATRGQGPGGAGRDCGPKLPGVSRGAGPPCLLPWGPGPTQDGGQAPWAVTLLRFLESGCPAPPWAGGKGRPPHRPPGGATGLPPFVCWGRGRGLCCHLGDCQATAADTAPGVRARLRAPPPPAPPRPPRACCLLVPAVRFPVPLPLFSFRCSWSSTCTR